RILLTPTSKTACNRVALELLGSTSTNSTSTLNSGPSQFRRASMNDASLSVIGMLSRLTLLAMHQIMPQQPRHNEARRIGETQDLEGGSEHRGADPGSAHRRRT